MSNKETLMRKLVRFKKVCNMRSDNGNDIPNQFILEFEYGRVFQSYSSIIVVDFYHNEKLGKYSNQRFFGEDWNASRTTSKYRNKFLGRDTKWCNEEVTHNRIKVMDF